MSLEKCQNITSLNLDLRCNNLGADGAKNIGMSLEKCQNITSLNLNLWCNELGADGAKNIGMSLEKCQNITSLNLNLWQFNQLSIYLVCFNQYICEIETQNKWVWRIN
ncbi:kinase domain protein (macronuclear) [Tetrahymena thermophila SB210]|uniref:Kinase domain protein n=1 Tax=Tetrahymena thermophila (strain SB210) TaxID=312017 RepID=Q228H2_TETTS|nr:kinase domain protein [Tetrahymena thermophila SB210]EAR81690.3 kinase domain protein [Tetrahymena thermophila SB210]|eukprot:XP_001029353.3 kinase domain protein [Tetrahymena thermophila SB210]